MGWGRRFISSVLLWTLLAGLAIASPARAVDAHWPQKPVTLVVPFPPGGGNDAFARTFASLLARDLGQPVLVENRAGGGGTVGTAATARMKPDGYTFLLAGTSAVVAPFLHRNPGYDLVRDFVPITTIAHVPMVVVVSSAHSSFGTLGELIAQAGVQKGRLTMATAGAGTTPHLLGELLQARTGARFEHVPYRGGSPALTDLLGGHVDLMIDTLGSSVNLVREGRLRALAVSAPERSVRIRDVPTFAEVGFTGLEADNWYGIWAIAGTPPDVVERLYQASVKTLETRRVTNFWRKQAATKGGVPPAEFARLIAADAERWGAIIRDAGVKLD